MQFGKLEYPNFFKNTKAAEECLDWFFLFLNEVKHQDFDACLSWCPVSPDRPTNGDSLIEKNCVVGSLEKLRRWPFFLDLSEFALKWIGNSLVDFEEFFAFLRQIWWHTWHLNLCEKTLQGDLMNRFPVEFDEFELCVLTVLPLVFSWPEIWRWSNEVFAPVELFRIYAMTWLNDFRVLFGVFQGFPGW